MIVMNPSFTNDEDFDTEWHRFRREEGWFGGTHVEVPYFLSCLCRTNYCGLSYEKWETELRRVIATKFSHVDWILDSTYFYEFSLLLLKDTYRNSSLGKRHPLPKEEKRKAATRFAILRPHLSLDQMAKELGTTAKQLQRNSEVSLAIREFKRVTEKRTQ